MKTEEITSRIKEKARRLGFDHVGVCRATTPPGGSRFDEWLARGYAGDMSYLSERRDAYRHPSGVLEGVRSLVMLAAHYEPTAPERLEAGKGRVARYATGSEDYHDTLRRRLHQLSDYLRELRPEATTRGVVDTAPLMEREFAQLAGLGWIGKNTLLINKGTGSYFFLAAVLTDEELLYDQPFEADHCGSCTACLEACPTGAFPEPYVLDASRCISYLTIEHRSPIDEGLRVAMGEWSFGCDVCQQVCPWNRDAPPTVEAAFKAVEEFSPFDLRALFFLDESDFRRRFRHTPLWRPHRRGLLRNAAIVLGNQQDGDAVLALSQGLQDEEPLVSGASAWALGQLSSETAEQALRAKLGVETNEYVLQEVRSALGSIDARKH
ncbi:MAG: tRNA epoxyqueuosine(34) reductase QueG [Planctomycetota bacterium]